MPKTTINIENALQELRKIIHDEYGWRTAIGCSHDDMKEFASHLMGLYLVFMEQRTGVQYENPFGDYNIPAKDDPCHEKKWFRTRTPAYITDRFHEYNYKHFLKRFFGAEWTYLPWRRFGELAGVVLQVSVHSSTEERTVPPFATPTPSYAMDMAKKLKEARIARGLTQMELAKLIGLSSNNRISRWEQGLALPSVENAVKLEKILSISVKKLF